MFRFSWAKRGFMNRAMYLGLFDIQSSVSLAIKNSILINLKEISLRGNDS